MTVDWNEENAAHLLRRSGFGATQSAIEAALAMSRSAAIDSLFVPDPQSDAVPFADPSAADLQGFWLARMVATSCPLAERQTLLLHDHFATAVSKVKKKLLMAAQNRTLRKRAFGKFRTLLLEMIRDPALLIFLDNPSNVKADPNENFARELMELFTTGVKDGNGQANYSEQDVSECARAFTGYTVVKGEFVFDASEHDSGMKHFKGATGAFDGEDIANRLADDPATARRIARKLWSTYAYPVNAKHPRVSELAQVFQSADTDLGVTLRYLFDHDDFYSVTAKQAAVIRSPAEFVVSALRSLGATPSSNPSHWEKLGAKCAALGQALFEPPSVFGWDGGSTWVEVNGLRQRAVVAEWIADMRSKPSAPFHFDPSALLGDPSLWPELTGSAVVDRILSALGPLTVAPSTYAVLVDYATDGAEAIYVDTDYVDRKVRGLIALALATPEFQLT